MKCSHLPGLILSALALLCWCAALFLGQGVARYAPGTLVRWPEGEGPSAADLDRVRRYAAQDGARDAPAADLWREKNGVTLTDAAGERSWTGSGLELYGDGGRVWPAAFLSGGYPALGDTEGVAVDQAVAHALWGSDQVVGSPVRLDGRTCYVRGVFRGTGGLVLTQGAGDSVAPYDHLLLTFLGENSRDRAEGWLTAAQLPPGTPVDLALWRWLLDAVTALPGLLLGLGCLLRLWTRGRALGRAPLLLGAYLLPALGLAALVLWAMGMPSRVPVQLIPTQWSDFAFWGELWQRLSGELRSWLVLTPGRRELELWLPALGCALLSVAAAGLTVPAAERVRPRTGPGAFLACCAALGLVYVCAMAFAGAGGVALPKSVWLMPPLWVLTGWGLDHHLAALEGDEHEQAAEQEA